MLNTCLLLLNALLLPGGSLFAQSASPVVEVTGAVRQTAHLTAAGLAAMPRAAVQSCQDGIEVKYEGVWLHEVLKNAGVPAGAKLRGPAMTGYVLVTARDGHQVLFAIAELDPEFAGNTVLLADTANAKPLAGIEAPFRLMIPGEKRAARAVRGVSRIEVVFLRK